MLVGHSGNCSNPEGARWLQHALGPSYSIEMVRVDKRFSHLDCVMLTPREGVAVVSKECLPDGVPDYMKGLGYNRRAFRDHQDPYGLQ